MATGVKKRAFSWMNKMGICNSYKTALKRNHEMSVAHDKLVLEWKEQHESEYVKENRDTTSRKEPAHYQVILLFTVA